MYHIKTTAIMNQVKKDYQELSGRLAFTPNGSPVVICGYSKPLGFLVGAIQESPEGWHEQLDLKHKIRIAKFYHDWPLGYCACDKAELIFEHFEGDQK